MITIIGKYYLVKSENTLITEIGQADTTMEISTLNEVVECDNEELYLTYLSILEKEVDNV